MTAMMTDDDDDDDDDDEKDADDDEDDVFSPGSVKPVTSYMVNPRQEQNMGASSASGYPPVEVPKVNVQEPATPENNAAPDSRGPYI